MNQIPPEVASTSSEPQWPLVQLVLARLREFYREPEAVFWVYGFPILMTVALGIAFRDKPPDRARVDVVQGAGAESVVKALSEKFDATVQDEDTARLRLRTGKTDLIVTKIPSEKAQYQLLLVPTKPESRLARDEADAVLQRAAGRKDSADIQSEELQEQGGRYIDFLVPGLLGMGLMGGGLWGVGFVTVDMRIRKLLKRFLATPMRRSDFLASLMISRLVFMIPEVLILLIFSWLVFGVVIAGNILAVLVFILLGSFTFAGIGLLVASRAKTMEAVSGLMNLVMLPMWVLSGIFFSSDRFPDTLQPFIQILPLTALINGLRAVMLEGVALTALLPEILTLVVWGALTFVIALRIFRWN